MKKQVLAAAVASLVAGPALAINVVDNGTTTFDIGGHIGARVKDHYDLETVGDSSRFNFKFTNKLTEQVTAYGTGEWGFDITNTNSEKTFFNNRLGFVGLTHDVLGSISFGKQWSTYSKIAGWTDTTFAADSGNATGIYTKEGHALGTARADDAVQYNFSMNGFMVSAQTQIGERNVDADRKRDESYAIAASYTLPMGLSVGAAYNDANVKSRTGGKDYHSTSWVLGAKFEMDGLLNPNDGLYIAATYADLQNVTIGINGNRVVADSPADTDSVNFDDAQGMEFIAQYDINENWGAQIGFYHLTGDEANQANKPDSKIQSIPVGVSYRIGSMLFTGTYQFDSSEVRGVKAKDKAVFQARYFF